MHMYAKAFLLVSGAGRSSYLGKGLIHKQRCRNLRRSLYFSLHGVTIKSWQTLIRCQAAVLLPFEVGRVISKTNEGQELTSYKD